MWPPALAKLKADLDIGSDEQRYDNQLQDHLDAAVAFVQRLRRGSIQFDPQDPEQFGLPEPTADLILGTLRLAGRWWARKKSPDALIQMEQLGSSRVPTFDPDIDRLLGIGQKRGPVFA